MIQQEIREYGGNQFGVSEGAALIEELNKRTEHEEDGYNSIAELGVKAKALINVAPSQVPPVTVSDLPLNKSGCLYLFQAAANTSVTAFTPTLLELGGKVAAFIDTTGDANFPLVNSVFTITMSGTSGTATLTVGANTYVITFNTDLTTTLADFITAEAANILADTGLIATSVGEVLTLIGDTAEAVSIATTTGDLDGERDQILSRQLTGNDFEEGEFDLFVECVKKDSASPMTDLVNYFYIKR